MSNLIFCVKNEIHKVHTSPVQKIQLRQLFYPKIKETQLSLETI